MTIRSDDWFVDAEIVLEARRLKPRRSWSCPWSFYRNDERASFVRFGAIWEFARNMTAVPSARASMTETILITGASGTLGRRLTAALRADGWRVRALVHRSSVGEADELVSGLDPRSRCDARRPFTAAPRSCISPRPRTRGGLAVLPVNLEAPRPWSTLQSTKASGGFSSSAPGRSRWTEARTAGRRREPKNGRGRVAARLDDRAAPGALRRRRQRRRRPDRQRAPPRARESRLSATAHRRFAPSISTDAVEALAPRTRSDAAIGKTYTLAGECTTVRGFAEACRRAARQRQPHHRGAGVGGACRGRARPPAPAPDRAGSTGTTDGAQATADGCGGGRPDLRATFARAAACWT